jgi:uncharacterized protein involved in exopolysaccharide biosynthesis
MQPNNYLSNSHIGKIFLDSFNLIKGNVKFVAGCTLAFFIASIVYTFTLTPKYQIIADVKLKQDNSNSSSLSGGSVLNLITGGGGGKSYWDFYNVVFSSEVAKSLWENGYDKEIFMSNYDEDSKKYINEPSAWEVVKSWIIGYEIDKEINFVDLQNHIKSQVDLDNMIEEQNLIRFTITTTAPKKYEELLADLIVFSDSNIKSKELAKNKNKIEFLSSRISEVADVEIKNAMIGLLKEQLLNESPMRSKNPDFINLQFIYFGFTFIGFMLSVLYLYIKKFAFSS